MIFRKATVEINRETELRRALCHLLNRQKDAIPGFYLEDTSRGVNGRAVGYIYGFVEAALKQLNLSVNHPDGKKLILSIFNEFDSGRGDELLLHLTKGLKENPEYIKGITLGSTQYRDWLNSGGIKIPTGWAHCFD